MSCPVWWASVCRSRFRSPSDSKCHGLLTRLEYTVLLTDGQRQCDCGLALLPQQSLGRTSESAHAPFNSASVPPLIQTGRQAKVTQSCPLRRGTREKWINCYFLIYKSSISYLSCVSHKILAVGLCYKRTSHFYSDLVNNN